MIEERVKIRMEDFRIGVKRDMAATFRSWAGRIQGFAGSWRRVVQGSLDGLQDCAWGWGLD